MENKETKTTAPESKEEVKETVKEAVKTEVKKAAAPKKPGRKSAAKKAEAVKAEPKKEAKAAAPKKEAKAAAPKKPGRKPGSKTKKAEATIKTMVEFDGISVDVAAVQEKIQAKYVADGHRVGAIKSFEIYINTAKRKAYYVINGKGGDDACVDLD